MKKMTSPDDTVENDPFAFRNSIHMFCILLYRGRLLSAGLPFQEPLWIMNSKSIQTQGIQGL